MVEDVAGIGRWQAARMNERSEILNELQKPIVTVEKTIKSKNGETTVTTNISLLTILFAALGPLAVAAIGTFLNNLANANNGPSDGMSPAGDTFTTVGGGLLGKPVLEANIQSILALTKGNVKSMEKLSQLDNLIRALK